MIRKKKGFVLLPVVLATFIMGMLGIGLASMYSGTFSTMNAGKAASKAKDFATIEGNYVKLNGYDTASSMTHDWESLSDLVGPDATGWQSKVETSSTATSADGNQVKVMKVAVKKDSDIASRYTYEVPVVQGKDSYTKAEIDAMMSVVNGNFTKVNNRIDAMIEDTNNIKTQINNLYADMDSLNKNLDKLHTLVENYRTSLLNSINGVQGNLDAEIAARKAADASESSARQSADNALNKRCDNIDGKIKDLQGALSNTQERVKSLEGRVSSLEGRTKNLEDRASALESGLDAETKARIAADKSITDELHSVRDNLTEKYKALKTSVDDIGGKVKNMSKDVKANTDNIASINELLKNSFVFNGKHNTGISLAYDATQKKMRAYYNGQEVPLGSQDIDYFNPIQVVDSDKEYTLANLPVYDTGNVIPNPYVKDLSLTFDPKTDMSEGREISFGQTSYVRGTATQLIRIEPGENLTHPVLKQVCLPGDKFIAVNERYYLNDGNHQTIGYYAKVIPVKEVIRAQDNTAEWNRLLKPYIGKS